MDVAIIGGGIGGLTAAIALLQGGLDVQVYERAAELREVGAGIQISPNAARLLHRLDLERALREVAVAPEAVEIRRWKDNAVLARLPFGAAGEAFFGAPYYTVHRADLHAVLREAVPRDRVHLGRRLTQAIPEGDHVNLVFADGSTVSASTVIGADGIHSALRRQIAPDEAQSSGKSAFRGLVPSDRLPELARSPRTLMWLGPGCHVICYPVSAGRLISWSAGVPLQREMSESWTALGRTEDALAALDGWNDEIRGIVRATDETMVLALYDRNPSEKRGEGRMTLLGDAAHPMLPFFAQGAAQAIEDAWVLAHCLKGATARSIEPCLRRYEELRRPRVDEVQQRSRQNGAMFQLPDGELQARRDAGLAALSLESYRWLYGYDASSALEA